MKAIVLHEYGPAKNLRYEDVPDPTLAPGEVLVRLTASSVNPIDYKMRSGAVKEYFPVDFPAILGRDVSGMVREVAPGVTSFKPGDKVLGMTSKTYAELVVIKAAELTLLPDNLDLVEAAALPLVTLTGEQLITRGTKIQSGQTVLVSGAIGGVGRTAVWTAKKAGATVIAGVRKSQVEQAADLRAHAIVALDDQDAMDRLGFLDAVANTVAGETAEKLLAKVKPGGIFASVVGPPANANLNPTVQIVSVQAVPDAASLQLLAQDIAAGRFTIPIDRMLALDQAADAHIAAENGGIGKVLLLA